MPWIKVIDENEATGKLKEVYAEIRRGRGKVANIMKIHSLHPHTMEKHLQLYQAIMFGSSGLTREERELIAVVVSTINGCEYCIKHHSEALYYYWRDRRKIQRLIKDFHSVDLSERLQRLLMYAVKLTKTPNAVNKADVELLRETGFSDKDILTINLVVSYFNFVNRIALGLGVEWTSDEVTGYRY
ncbi:MAG TPA: peroxidase [Thermoplasmatales archaeon]|nr:peroxidase [Thermoplasmatales archaeon]